MQENHDEQNWFFTFGHGQQHGPDCYAVFHGTFSSARAQMFEHFGPEWSFQYGPTRAAEIIEKYDLKKIN